MRTASISRKTKETEINLSLNLDGSGKAKIKSPLNFLNHMLETLAKHSLFDLEINAKGDIAVEDHHLVEDTAICLGIALDKALGDKRGITRLGDALVPMEDSISVVAVDLSGRGYAIVKIEFSEFQNCKIGDVKKENIIHFLESFALNGKFNLYVKSKGRNDHHKVESCFKALGKALREATTLISKDIPSVKGVL